MSEPVLINNIFAIGYRCNVDEFLGKFLGIRKYSSPFSYIVIDLETALDFIDTKFENYTNKDWLLPGKRTYTFNKRFWICTGVHKCSKITNDRAEILNMDKVCIWVHHNLKDASVIDSINRRSKHLLECLTDKPNTTLFFYIEKIQKWEGNEKNYFNKSLLDRFDCKFLIIIPFLQFPSNEPLLFYEDEKVRIIYFKSNLNSWATAIECHVDQWNKLKNMLTQLYTFDIEERKEIN